MSSRPALAASRARRHRLVGGPEVQRLDADRTPERPRVARLQERVGEGVGREIGPVRVETEEDGSRMGHAEALERRGEAPLVDERLQGRPRRRGLTGTARPTAPAVAPPRGPSCPPWGRGPCSRGTPGPGSRSASPGSAPGPIPRARHGATGNRRRSCASSRWRTRECRAGRGCGPWTAPTATLRRGSELGVACPRPGPSARAGARRPPHPALSPGGEG